MFLYLTAVEDAVSSTGSFSLEIRKLATSNCLLFLVGMNRSPPALEGVFWVLPFFPVWRHQLCNTEDTPTLQQAGAGPMWLLPGVLLGVLERLADLLTLLFGEREFVLVELDVLAFLCHLAIGAFVMGMSRRRTLWMSFSNPKWDIITAAATTLWEKKNT